MNLSAEQFDTLMKALSSSSGQNSSILVFTGILALAAIIVVVWFILSIRLRPVEQLEVKMDDMQKTLNEMNTKLWTSENLDNRITAKMHEMIKDHERECPFRKR